MIEKRTTLQQRDEHAKRCIIPSLALRYRDVMSQKAMRELLVHAIWRESGYMASYQDCEEEYLLHRR